MDALVNAFLAISLLVVLILIVYLVDRVNSIERETRRVAQSLSAAPAAAAPQGPFFGLSGKKLWDTLSGRAPESLGSQSMQELREAFEVVLQKHIQSLFEEGLKDGQRGLSAEPKNTRLITTARGTVESWIPAAQANALYKCGMDCAQLPPAEWAPVAEALDDAGLQLFSKVQLDLLEPLSLSLMPAPDPLALPALDGAKSPPGEPGRT